VSVSGSADVSNDNRARLGLNAGETNPIVHGVPDSAQAQVRLHGQRTFHQEFPLRMDRCTFRRISLGRDGSIGAA